MGRPVDWTPLRGCDPTPGDPEAVREEVSAMEDTIAMLERQARALEAMAEDSERLQGKYAEAIREKAGDTGKQLLIVADRYTDVSQALGKWAEDMEEAQQLAGRALRKAQSAEIAMQSCAEQPDEDNDATRALETAEEEYGEAETLMERAERQYSDDGDEHAESIRNAIKDDLKDSAWDKFKGWVDDADWLRSVMMVASWVATAAGFAALFIPGLGQVALLLTIAVAANNFVQAVTGNGSVLDALLSVGCLSFIGKGLKAGKKLAAVHRAAKPHAARAARDKTVRERLQPSRQQRQQRNDQRYSNRLKTQARHAGNRAAKEERNREAPEVTRLEVAKAVGNREAASQIKDLRRMESQYVDSVRVYDAAGRGELHCREMIVSWVGSTGIDGVDKALTIAMPSTYADVKNAASVDVG